MSPGLFVDLVVDLFVDLFGLLGVLAGADRDAAAAGGALSGW